MAFSELAVSRIGSPEASGKGTSAGISIHVIFHLGFVQVTNPEHFIHPRQYQRDILHRNPVGDFPLFDGLLHFTYVGMELSLAT